MVARSLFFSGKYHQSGGCSMAMLVAGTVPWPLCIFPENRCRSWWGGGVGWVGDDNVFCTCTHVTCYATAGVVGWGGLGMMTFFALAHM